MEPNWPGVPRGVPASPHGVPAQPAVTAPRSQLRGSRDFLPIPKSSASICAPKPGKFYILSRNFFLILPVVTLDILVLRMKVRSLFECCRVSGHGDALDAAEPGGAARPPSTEQAAEIWKENEKSNGNNLVFLQALV